MMPGDNESFRIQAENCSRGWRVHPLSRFGQEPNGWESLPASCLDAGLQTPRACNAQKDGARILAEGGARSSMGRSASRPHTIPRSEHAPARRSWRRASRRTTGSTDGARTLPAARHGSRRRRCRGAPAGRHPQEHQTRTRAGQRPDRTGMADRLRNRFETTPRAAVARTTGVRRRNSCVHGTRADRTHESFDRFAERSV